MGIFGEDGAAAAPHGMACSSYDSHSDEQLISSTETNQKLADHGLQTESSNHKQVSLLVPFSSKLIECVWTLEGISYGRIA